MGWDGMERDVIFGIEKDGMGMGMGMIQLELGWCVMNIFHDICIHSMICCSIIASIASVLSGALFL
jgi:hypothetical protein